MDREKAIKGIHQHCKGSLFDRCGECPYYDIDFSAWEESKFKCRDELLSDALDLLKEQEAVVRCKDCKNGEPGACGYGIDCDGFWHDDDWYCADGVRKSLDEILMEKMDADPLG